MQIQSEYWASIQINRVSYPVRECLQPVLIHNMSKYGSFERPHSLSILAFPCCVQTHWKTTRPWSTTGQKQMREGTYGGGDIKHDRSTIWKMTSCKYTNTQRRTKTTRQELNDPRSHRMQTSNWASTCKRLPMMWTDYIDGPPQPQTTPWEPSLWGPGKASDELTTHTWVRTQRHGRLLPQRRLSILLRCAASRGYAVWPVRL
jgi:hypothetical protein